MPPLDPHKLNSLLEVSRRGSMAAAARALHLTPAAVSQHIRALETSLGLQVLHRTPTGAELTDIGRRLVEHAGTIETSLEAAQADVAGALGTTTLSIGFFPSLAGPLVSALDAIDRGEERLTFHMTETAVEDAAVAVRNRDLHAAFTIEWPDNPQPKLRELTYLEITNERLLLAHSVPNATEELHSFSDAHWVVALDGTGCGRATRNACRRAGFEPRLRHQTNDFAAAATLAALPGTVTVLPEILRPPIPDGVQLTPIAELSRSIQLVTRTDRHAGCIVLADRVAAELRRAGSFDAKEHP